MRYDKDFETLFDDRATLKDKKPARIVRIRAHFSKEYLVGIQLTYMTAEEELIEGKFHGDKKVSINNLQKVQYEVQYRERIEEITAHFSRGIHWIELKTNEGKSFVLGSKQTYPKAITQTKRVDKDKGEQITYISGGYTGKDYRFTYLAFHLMNGWNAPVKHF